MLVYIISTIFLITYIFSIYDKIIDLDGTYDYYSKHFEKTSLKNYIRPLIRMVISIELVLIIMFSLGLWKFFLEESRNIIEYALFVNLILLLIFLVAQRMAKDYQGAANLINYISLSLISLVIVFNY